MKSSMESKQERAGIQSVEVGFALLDALSAGTGPMMLRDLAAAAGMSAAKAHRYLVSYQRLGLVTQDAGDTRYDLGPAALKLGLATLARQDAIRMARERVPTLLQTVGHTVALAVWGNHGPTMVHWAETPTTITTTLRLGDVMPLLTSATGLCFAAHLPYQAVAVQLQNELAQEQKLKRPKVPQSQAELDTLLADVRQRGLARVANTLVPGVAGFCAPVFDADKHMVLGMVVLGSNATLPCTWDSPAPKALLAAARQLSADLGYQA
jgi:DNA-binding IclR family transcriptional regulator